MRILHLVWRGRFSGAEMLVRDLALYHRRQGHEIAIAGLGPTEVSFRPEIDALAESGVSWYAPMQAQSRLGKLMKLRRTVAKFTPDIIIAHAIIPAFYARTFALLLPCPIMTVLHCGSCDDYAEQGAWSERRLSHRAAAVVAVSNVSLDNYRRRIGEHPRLCHIRNGVSLRRYRTWPEDRATIRRSLGLTDDERVLLQIGRVSRIKRQHLTMAALGRLKDAGKQVTTLFLGPSEDAGYAQELANDLARFGLADRVRLLGGRTDVPALLLAADALAMPSSTESQGLALIEGLAAGLPVVASQLPAFSSFAGLPGVTLLDPQDTAAYAEALDQALSSPRHQHDLDEWDLAATADNYLTLATDLIAAHRH